MSMVWEKMIKPLMFRLDPERAHDIGMTALRSGLFSSSKVPSAIKSELKESFGIIERFGLTFENPLGLAAGFDKNCIAIHPLANLGFGFVEVGTVTLEPQLGNPKPRIFRLPDQNALINRLGFNNDGAHAVGERLMAIRRNGCIIGVNIGRNKEVTEEKTIENYSETFDLLSPCANYITVNVSSPNTPGLRALQQTENLKGLIRALTERNTIGIPLLVKISPDLSEAEIEAIVDTCVENGVSGLIATNTTISRLSVPSGLANSIGAGGLSGTPLKAMSTDVINTIYRHSKGKIPIVGVGGVFTAEDAFAKVGAGASLIQAYTGFVFGGPSFAREVNLGLARLLRYRGFRSLDEAVGSSHV